MIWWSPDGVDGAEGEAFLVQWARTSIVATAKRGTCEVIQGIADAPLVIQFTAQPQASPRKSKSVLTNFLPTSRFPTAAPTPERRLMIFCSPRSERALR